MGKKLCVYFLFFFLLFFITGIYFYAKIKYFAFFGNKDFVLKNYPEDLILKTGGRLESPKSRFQRFLNFSHKKKKNVIRIGAFGDSYTYGSDVEKQMSYPHQLQNMFDNSLQDKKVEVLNFGVRGHSFQEQFFLYEKYHENYKIDYVLLGPKGFYPDRNVTFRKNWEFKKLYYPRERFILSSNNEWRCCI